MSHPTHAQKLDGKYSVDYAVPGNSTLYTFDQNNFFIASSYDLSHGMYYARGYFIEKVDSLILVFDSVANPNASRYWVVEKNDSISKKWSIKDQTAIVHLEIVDENDSSFTNGIVALMRGDDVIAVYPNSSSYFIQTEGKVATHIAITNYDLTIPLEDFWGYESKIRVQLLPRSWDVFQSNVAIKKYLIKTTQQNKKIELTDCETGDQIVLTKLIQDKN
jgi:hypothetical protein